VTDILLQLDFVLILDVFQHGKKNIAAKAGSVGESLIETIKTNDTKTETEE
jgi:hypothetical protein